ncbi:hypothetical protein [Streptomyces sp. 6N223]|uniref:hypothetical protein n=1 Tax=Streptomyces sp. 6N223 TaxID=3457412 RepID=UPI003FD49D31
MIDASTSALVVAIVGVLGTLTSGALAHRGALRAKTLELDHAREERREEREAQERHDLREARRASYATFNQSLRQHHAALFSHHRALTSGEPPAPGPLAETEETRQVLRGVYAEVQMVASDEVLKRGGDLFHLLGRIYTALRAESPDGTDHLAEAKDHLDRASEMLYEARQTMRSDLGITDLPIERPADHGIF